MLNHYVYKYVKNYFYKRIENPENGFTSFAKASAVRDDLVVDAITRNERCSFIILSLPGSVDAPESIVVTASLERKN